ncbi:filamentous hemagglutinin N-terminal domain-containing protein [Leptolyngbya sp. AN03gr2]|uniref:two-partner secretion domain-containing protein n=1 Tax=Leptolyngbya sp. AN10 TaxID=3423365 RepID=UPI003D32255E
MKTQAWMLGLALMFGVGLSDRSIAQVVPDLTLPVGERSQISGDPNIQIEGGATRGNNLFHSFQQFSIPTGSSASFNNAPNITNIITRVTGSNVSNIDGLIRANGTANLFLINPNGILFGANARLEIGGSFLASTAESLKFDNEFEFSASNPQSPPLLTISAPIGLQYENRSGEVRSQGAILQVPNGQTLALVGGDVAIDGGQLLAPGGRIALGGISEAGTVVSNSDGSLSFPDSLARGNVVLTNGASVDVTAGGGGEIAISARNLDMSAGSRLRAGIGEGLGSAQAQAGRITIQAAENVTLRDESFIENLIAAGGIGKGGDVVINARSLFLTNGSQIAASIFGEGAGGTLTVKATDSIQLVGESADGQFFSGLYARTESRGDAGNLSIETGTLIVRDGAIVSASTFGEGAGGNLTVKATDSIQLVGEPTDARFGSGLYAQTNPGSRGDAGNLSIETGTLIVRDGARAGSGTFGEGAGGNLTVKATDSIQLIGTSADGQFGSNLFTDTSGRGDAGNLSIETGTLIVRGGAQVSVGTFGEGEGGTLTVKATDSIQLIGESADAQSPSGLYSDADSRGNAGNINIETGTLIVRDGAQVSSATFGEGAGGNLTVNATDSIQVIGISRDGEFGSRLTANTRASGNAGEITLNTRQLLLGDGGLVSSQQITPTATGSVGSIRVETLSLSVGNNASLTVEDARTIVDRQSTKSAGNIDIQTNSLRIDRGLISAATASTDGGNIGLDVQDVLLLRNGGRISTDAGTAQAGGNGGNITLNSNFIVAVPEENSIISANAFTGRGGNIRITTQGLIGIEPRSSTTTGLSSITASSQFGISGTIVLNTPDVDPSQGLVQLPAELQDTSGLIASTCPADEGNSFAITGRGGLPDDPRQPLMSDRVWIDDRAPSQSSLPTAQPVPEIVEAQGWIKQPDGSIHLVATYPSSTSQVFRSLLCAVRSN